jgi:hypothetical protein
VLLSQESSKPHGNKTLRTTPWARYRRAYAIAKYA